MKTSRNTREREADELRKARRLEPMRKSGKERRTLYDRYDEEDEDFDPYPRRESAFDYFEEEER